MFKLFSKSKKKESAELAEFGLLKTDMHSHLIPGIDDGAPDIETSLRLIGGLYSLGYRKIITTPHIMWDMYKNSRETILERLEWLRTTVKEAELDIEIHAAPG
jgi:protein-tyrosine phosphatase